MAPKTRGKRAKAGAKDPNPKQTIKSKVYINTREDEGHCAASVRSEDTETTLQDTANAAAANVSAAPVDSIEPVDPQESAEVPSPAVLPEWNGRRRHSGQPTDDELEVADFFVTEDLRSRWEPGSASDDVLVAADTMVQFKNDPNYSAPVQKESRPKRNQTRRSRRS